ncbi:hypothetical protein TNCV_264361 [Trichonephila clavipes]|nr:hypothetical protein TNCV_264361 [Trichonephila clavipes]
MDIVDCLIERYGEVSGKKGHPALQPNPMRLTERPSWNEGILKSHSLSSLLNYLRAFGDGPVAGVPGGQGIESWLACLEFEPSATKDPP